MQLPPQVIDYVVVHELAHLKIPDHSPAFWREVRRVLPDFYASASWSATRQRGRPVTGRRLVLKRKVRLYGLTQRPAACADRTCRAEPRDWNSWRLGRRPAPVQERRCWRASRSHVCLVQFTLDGIARPAPKPGIRRQSGPPRSSSLCACFLEGAGERGFLHPRATQVASRLCRRRAPRHRP